MFLYMSIYDSESIKRANLLGPYVAKFALRGELIPALRTLEREPRILADGK